MIGASGRRVRADALRFGGNDGRRLRRLWILPSWVPFQGPASDTMPGVVPPRERIAAAARSYRRRPPVQAPAERQQISEQLAAAIRTEKDPLIRLEIIRTLGHYPGPAADAILKAALSDPEARIRMAACEAWGKRNDAQAVDCWPRRCGATLMPTCGWPPPRPWARQRTPRPLPALGEALTDTDPAMQYRAVLSLRQATGKDLGESVERWQQYVKGSNAPGPGSSLADRDPKPILTPHHRITS